MKVVLVLLAFLFTAFALPEPRPTATVDIARNSVFKRDDDDWVVVAYSDAANGGQCGGTPTSYMGQIAGACVRVAAKCVDVAISATTNTANMQATVKFDSTKCGGQDSGILQLLQGENKKGYNVGDKVEFFDVSFEELTNSSSKA
ncbi:hypothetical protein PRZ48_013193 [Zasmidium cellare]|uniref:Barwin domain-containing protein n=1 Tax=Zasmidium cellare TaxID=395010 RepID=A0ABR0E3T0_ZASCE|nr:hypothetical protein PRZ48_013193 [Zasmidium cellare]